MFEKWQINDREQTLCVKRSGGKYYKTAPTEEKCKGGEKECGEGDGFYCVDEDEDCPIYEFRFDTAGT